MKRKIKVFLSGIVNVTNSQNLTCLAVARNLDKQKFEVRTLLTHRANFPVEPMEGVEFLRLHYPARIWHVIQLVRGILWADVSFLPKPEHWKLQRFILRLFRKKSFTTVEGICSGIARERAIKVFGSEAAIREYHTYTTKTYSITNALIAKNRELIGLPEPAGILHLITDTTKFAMERKSDALRGALLLGEDLKRKGLDDYLALTRQFPEVKFHVVGGGVGGDDYAAQCKASGLPNVVFHGSLTHDQLKAILPEVQLHVLPSRAEGFPKVIIETAAAGLPSLVYGDYGADEWITTGKDGFVVNTVEEMSAVFRDLLDHPGKMQPLADGARELARRFDAREVIKEWEVAIQQLAKGE